MAVAMPSNIEGARSLRMFFTSDSSVDNASKLPKTEAAQGLSVPSKPNSPAAAIFLVMKRVLFLMKLILLMLWVDRKL